MKAMIKGIEMGYEVLGQTRQPIVLIHGFGLNRSIWCEMAARYLQDDWEILPVVRGYGESVALEGVYNIPLLAEDVAHLLNGV